MPNLVPLADGNLDFDVFPFVPGLKPPEIAAACGPGGNTGPFCQVRQIVTAGAVAL